MLAVTMQQRLLQAGEGQERCVSRPGAVASTNREEKERVPPMIAPAGQTAPAGPGWRQRPPASPAFAAPAWPEPARVGQGWAQCPGAALGPQGRRGTAWPPGAAIPHPRSVRRCCCRPSSELNRSLGALHRLPLVWWRCVIAMARGLRVDQRVSRPGSWRQLNPSWRQCGAIRHPAIRLWPIWQAVCGREKIVSRPEAAAASARPSMARLARRWAGPSPLSVLLNSLEGSWTPIEHCQARQLLGFATKQNKPAPRVPPRPATRRFGDREWADEYRWGRADMQMQQPARPWASTAAAAVPPACPPRPRCHPACHPPAAAAGWRLAGLPCSGCWSRSGGMQRAGCSAARSWRGDWSGRCCAWLPPPRCLRARGGTLCNV